MTRTDITNTIRNYVQQSILDGEAVELDPDTPLIELGILNSVEILAAVRFLEKTFEVVVPMNMISPANLGTLQAMTNMVLELNPKASPSP